MAPCLRVLDALSEALSSIFFFLRKKEHCSLMGLEFQLYSIIGYGEDGKDGPMGKVPAAQAGRVGQPT